MKTPWKNSLFTVTLMTALQSIVTTHVMAQASPNGAATTAASTDPLSQLSEDDKFRMRYGLPPNGASAGQPAKQVAATRHDPATDREMRRRYGLLPASPSNNSASGDASELEAKLKRIVIDTVSFERLPLSEVIQSLSEAAAKNDPDRVGLNFLIHNNSPDGSAGRPSIDPATGLPLATTSEPLDVGSVLVNLSLPLRHVNLKEVLDAIVKVADHPIQYSVEEYAVVFSPRAESDSSIPALRPTALGARTFKVNTNTFVAGLQSAFGISVSYEKTDGAQKPNMKLALRQLLDELGIPAGSGRSIFYNEMTGMVMVRASEDEMRTLEAAMETLTGQSAGPLDQAKIGY